MPGAESVSLGLYFPTGSRHETRLNNGISHFIEHLVFKGTQKRSAEQINREIDMLGGASNAYTSKETVCFHARVLPAQLPRLVELLADLATNALPNGLEEELEREREVILAEISALEDSPEDLVGDVCDQAYFGEHPLALPVVGSARAVARLALPEIRDHFVRHVVARDMVVAAAGDVEHEQLLSLVSEHLSGIPQGGRRPGLQAPSVQRACRVVERELEQVQLCLSAAGVSRGDPRRRSAELLSFIVGEGYSSRLFREVRDRRGLAYSIYTSFSCYLDAGSLNIHAGVSPERLDQMLAVVGEVLADVRSGGITADELEAAKLHLSTSIVLGHETSGARMGFLADQVMLNDRGMTLASELAAIERVRLDDLHALGSELLAEPLALGLVGPVSSDRFPASGWEIPA
jgi:predicted Zn-dependent peptidase